MEQWWNNIKRTEFQGEKLIPGCYYAGAEAVFTVGNKNDDTIVCPPDISQQTAYVIQLMRLRNHKLHSIMPLTDDKVMLVFQPI
jgi:hypothetical protein